MKNKWNLQLFADDPTDQKDPAEEKPKDEQESKRRPDRKSVV